MLRIYKTIKKKRNLRRVSVVFLFLVFIELFCPVFCDEPAFAAKNISSKSVIISSFAEEKQTGQDSMSAHDCQDPDHDGDICNDECLCHSTAISNFAAINLEHHIISTENIAYSYGEPLFNSLSPPFQPPKNS